MDLIIEGDPESLEWLRREITLRIGAPAELEPKYDTHVGRFSEPILVALIVALGGKEIITTLRAILARRYEHLEKMRGMELRLKIQDNETERPVTIGELDG